MKNLTKMIAVLAAATSMHCAQAESVEKSFMPTEKSGEIKGIKIVNGQIEVHTSNASVAGPVETPYIYVSTNTDHFASSAFANPMQGVDQYTHVGNGKIYITEKGNSTDVWATEIKKAPASLNGVTAINKVEGQESTVPEALLEAQIDALEDGYLTKSFNGKVYRAVTGDETSPSRIEVYNPETGTWSPKNSLSTRQEITDFYIVPTGNNFVAAYALCADGKVYSDRPSFISGREAVSLHLDDDKETVVVVSNNDITLYDGKTGKAKEVAEEATTTLSANRQNEMLEEAQATAGNKIIVDHVFAGKTLFFVTEKTMGFVR